jgi:sugar lactone lactonase YvrE
VVLDTSGNVYVTDYVNMTIRKVTPAGVVTTLAGSPGVEGFVNGTGSAARFKSLQGIAIDTSGNLFIADAGNRSIRKVTPAGVVTTFVDGTNGQLGTPRGIVMDSTGTLYVTDYTNHVIYRVTSAGAVSRFAGFERGAGVAPQPGSTDGTTATALFNAPSAVAVDSAGNLYIADTSNNTVRKIASGNVTTLAGQAGRSSSVDGKGSAARFEDP